MPTNRIRVVYDETGIKCKVWDKDGNKFNVTDIFQKIGGAVTSGGVWSNLSLSHGSNSLQTELQFKSIKKDLKFDVEESVIDQILQMGASEDGSPDED